MIIYLAGGDGNTVHEPRLGECHRLVSYWVTRKWKHPLSTWRNKYSKAKTVFLDCGAFSAWKQGKSIDIHEYCEYLCKNKDSITTYAALDVKGNSIVTMKNLEIMEKQYQLKPIPVWHLQGGEWDLYEELVKKYDYIAIGAIAGENLSKDSLEKSLKNLFAKVKRIRGKLIKLHGFGFTTLKYLIKYPFYSADSTSWLAGARYGVFEVFDEKDCRMRIIGHRDRESIIKHWELLSPETRKLSLIKDNKNKDIFNYTNRLDNSILAYKRMQEYLTKVWEKRGVTFQYAY